MIKFKKFILLFILLLSINLYPDNLINKYYKFIKKYNPQIKEKEIYNILHISYLIAKKFDIDIDIILAIMKVESNFRNIKAKKENSYGYMQVSKKTANWLVRSRKIEKFLLDPVYNILIGCEHLKNLKNKYGNIWEAVRRYNGSGKQSFKYLHKVLKYYNELKNQN